MADSTWEKKDSVIVHTNPWYDIRKDIVVRPDGKSGEYYVMQTRGPAVYIVAISDQKEIYLMKEHRYPLGKAHWEIPGGNAGKEELTEAALRELKEETGLVPASIELLGPLEQTESILEEDGYIFLARGVRETRSDVQGDEGIEKVQKFPIPDVLRMIKENELIDATSVSAVTRTLLFLNFTIQNSNL